MIKLTEVQTELLHAAAESEAGAPRNDETTAVAKTLIKRGLLISMPVANGPSRLVITNAGREAIGQTAAPRSPAMPAAGSTDTDSLRPSTPPATPTASPKGKLGDLVGLLRQDGGATLAAMMAATGWQAHSVRGAISGAVKKKLGLAVLSEKVGGERVYRIIAQDEA